MFSDPPTTTTVTQHDIELTDPRPIKQHPKRELMKGEVQYLLNNGFAEPSSGSWSSPCLVEAKPYDFTQRQPTLSELCVVYC